MSVPSPSRPRNPLLHEKVARALEEVARNNDLPYPSNEGDAMQDCLVKIENNLCSLITDARINPTHAPLYRHCVVRALSKAVCDI